MPKSINVVKKQGVEMKITINSGVINQVQIDDFDHKTATDADILELKSLVYKHKIAVLKNQNLSPKEYVEFSKRIGTPEAYYQPMYHHPEQKEVFVSSNIPKDGKQIGVPRTGKFWHADYSFMKKPFAFTLIYPQVIPSQSRGTYFIDMGKVYESLPQATKDKLEGLTCIQSVRKYFKIRPTDVYRPISEVLQEIEKETPAVTHKAVFTHPVTNEKILFISEGFSQQMLTRNGQPMDGQFLEELLTLSGQKDSTFGSDFVHIQRFEKGDMLFWDNRSLVHCALHTTAVEPTESYRITLHDQCDFYDGVNQLNQAIKAQQLEPA